MDLAIEKCLLWALAALKRVGEFVGLLYEFRHSGY